MIDLPVEAKENIIRTQGENGKAFFDNLPKRLEIYTNKWKLCECKFFAHSTNLIYACKSDIYGDVIIKAGVPEDRRLLTEISALKFYNDKEHTCKLYDYSLEDGFMLFERITPGITLKDTIPDPIKRVNIFINIFKHYHLPCDDTATFPTYISLIEMFASNLDSYPHFIKYKDIIKTLYNEISKDYSRKYLLHGDLHFHNILSHDKTFKVIDPHGIIGDPIFDITRYLSNELSDAILKNRSFNNNVVLCISKQLGIPILTLYGLLVIDVIHHAGYHLGNPITKSRYDFQLKRCETAYKLYLSAL